MPYAERGAMTVHPVSSVRLQIPPHVEDGERAAPQVQDCILPLYMYSAYSDQSVRMCNAR